MGPTINYTRRSTHPKHGVAKNKLEERRERQQLAQNRMQEAVKRAVLSTAGAKAAQRHTAPVIGKKWAFSHARREGDRRMGPAAPTYRSALSTSAYAPIPPEKLEKKKLQLLATADWASLSRSNSPASRSSSTAQVHVKVRHEPDGNKIKHQQTKNHPPEPLPKPELNSVPTVKLEVKKEDLSLHHDTSSTDINMPSSPPRPDMTLYSSTQSNFSTSLSGLPSSTQTYKTRVEDIKPSSEVLSAVLSTQDSVATQGSSASKSIKKERSHSQPMLRLPPRHTELAPLAELRHLPPPLAYMKFVNDFTDRNMACSFLLPCMLADSGSPFVYDGIPRSEDYLGMAFAGLRWEA